MRNSVASQDSLIVKGLRELSLPFTPDQVRLFSAYLTELKKWNKAYNLTSLKTDEDIVIKHFLDSLLYLRALPPGEISVLDVGSGAGFPGIPLKIMRPEIGLYLLEPSWKKANFLRHIAGTLCLSGVEIIEKRIEDLEPLLVDVAMTRALFSIPDFSKKAGPFVREGGSLIMSKGPRLYEEVKATKEGIPEHEIMSLILPLSAMKRHLVIITRKRPPSPAPSPHRSNPRQRVTPEGPNLCINADCRLRKAGCRGFEGCPGFQTKS